MTGRSATPWLHDIIDAIKHIRDETEGTTRVAFEADWRKRWLVERGIEIISEANRRRPADIKVRHPGIP